MTKPIIVWQFGPAWGLSSGSPFCTKLEAWLRMAQLPYELRNLTGPAKSPSGKAPYIERDDGSVLCDSTLIIETLTREHDVQLDAGLDDDQRTQALLIQRLLEEELYFHGLHARWVENENWPRTRDAYFNFVPPGLRHALGAVIRRQVVAAGKGQGISRLPAELRRSKGEADVAALAHLLGDREYFFDRPTTTDAIAFAFLWHQIDAPFDGYLVDAIRARHNLVDYVKRMRDRYWSA
jgi:glutathione S-transferase